MAQTLTPGSVVSMTDRAADRLLQADSGDAALLYLHLLRRGTFGGLSWSAQRLERALEELRKLDMAPDARPVAEVSVQEVPPPEYSLADVNRVLEEKSSAFSALADEVERRLGRKLTANDLKLLLTLYDHLALPAEVVLLLVNWCAEQARRKHGDAARPSLSRIRAEGFAWVRQGVDTLARAEEHIARLTRMKSREGEVLRLLDITPRPLVEREQTYIAAWDEMGFDDGALRLAYEKTVLKKQSMDWGYMNGILRRWHEQGLHTAQAVHSGDRDPRGARQGEDTRRAREDMERLRRVMEQVKREGK